MSKKQTLERQNAVQLRPDDTGKSLVYNIPENVLNKDPFNPRYYIRDKNREELIKYFESGIRDSFEYKWLIDIFKTTLDVKSCVFFKGYTIENGMKLEFHHHPFTLYDYTEAVVNKQLQLHGEEDDHGAFVLENEVMKEVVQLHYRLMIGLVPLDPTSHALVHDGELEIQKPLIIGDFEKFFNEYYNYIPSETKFKYHEFMDSNPVDAELSYPYNWKYKPMVVMASNKQIITSEKIDSLLLADKISKVNNENISRLLEERK